MLNERLRSFRNDVLKISQSKIALLLQIKQNTYGYYETGKSNPPTKVLNSLSKLGFDMNWLITGKGEVPQSPSAEIEELQKRLPSLRENSRVTKKSSHNYKAMPDPVGI